MIAGEKVQIVDNNNGERSRLISLKVNVLGVYLSERSGCPQGTGGRCGDYHVVCLDGF